jgi:hypothetical protein
MVTVKEEIELLYHGRIHQFILERIDDQVEQQTFAYQVTSTTTVHFKTVRTSEVYRSSLY